MKIWYDAKATDWEMPKSKAAPRIKAVHVV